MSNVDSDPDLLECEAAPHAQPQLLEPRLVPLGGIRAMPVRRTLPQRARSLIGAWCFVDHYGPNEVSATQGMSVPGHPHTGLQTVSWLFAGVIEHLDTVGSRSLIRAGEMNLMTAGRGIAHSEYSTPETTVLHGVQLWVALPERDRFTEPRFEHYAPVPVELPGARVSVFLGSLLGSTSPVRTSTALLGAEVNLAAGSTLTIETQPGFEYGILVDAGDVRVGDITAAEAELLYLPPQSAPFAIEAGDRPVRALLLGGEPLDERIIMWWNFVGRTHDEIVRFRDQWQQQAAGDHTAIGPYGRFPQQWVAVLPAPALPGGRLKPRA